MAHNMTYAYEMVSCFRLLVLTFPLQDECKDYMRRALASYEETVSSSATPALRSLAPIRIYLYTVNRATDLF